MLQQGGYVRATNLIIIIIIIIHFCAGGVRAKDTEGFSVLALEWDEVSSGRVGFE